MSCYHQSVYLFRLRYLFSVYLLKCYPFIFYLLRCYPFSVYLFTCYQFTFSLLDIINLTFHFAILPIQHLPFYDIHLAFTFLDRYVTIRVYLLRYYLFYLFRSKQNSPLKLMAFTNVTYTHQVFTNKALAIQKIAVPVNHLQ